MIIIESNMRALKCDASKGELSLEDVEVPELINSDDVIIKVGYAGLCGTDLHIIAVSLAILKLMKIQTERRKFHESILIILFECQGEFAVCGSSKVTLGHEFSGTVVSVGQAVNRFKNIFHAADNDVSVPGTSQGTG